MADRFRETLARHITGAVIQPGDRDVIREALESRIDKDENRIKIEFGFKPDDSTRTKLKRSGFRWSPRNEAWQSYIHDYQLERAKQIVQEMPKND